MRISLSQFVVTSAVLAYLFGLVYLKRSFLNALYAIISPLALTFVLLMVTSSNLHAAALFGGLALTLMNDGLGLGSSVAMLKADFKYQDILVASTVSQTSYMTGLALAGLLNSAPALVVYFVLLLWGKTYFASVALIGLALTIWITFSALSFFIATYLSTAYYSWPLLGLISYALAILPPVFYPITILPKWLQTIMLLIPTTHYSLLANFILVGATGWMISVTISFIYVLVFLILALVLVRFRARWRDP